ncbi:EAL domain-containing protein [Blastomonas aquatica]|uniref:Diguanylate cyclase n=1 Tax=Blastomonas aquatica TaxID=1510276 RepID=A0ABQ1J094_9SPHN|nr:EAL domain-containing protein [Blastomonas aquatica]GGB56833.1 hypothetical protein GCM10010833_09450 [Blastomonas aquatica]
MCNGRDLKRRPNRTGSLALTVNDDQLTNWASPQTIAAEPSNMEGPASDRCHALIIEDECLIAMDLAALVETAGATSVAFATTESEAVESARKQPPDVILSDVNLFEGSGPCAVRSIIRDHGEIPVIFITSSPEGCKNFGRNCTVFQKPVSPEELIAKFSQVAADRLGQRRRAQRRKAIGEYQILDSPPETNFDEITMLVARLCETNSAAISFIDDHRQWFKATCGIDERETPIDVSFCLHAIASETVFVVNDAHLDPLFANNALVTGAPFIRFYAGMRILSGDGTPIASLCVFDPHPRALGLTTDQEATLRVLAGQVQSLLELRRLLIEREEQVAAQIALADELRYVAEHDVLTGLPHRGPFNTRLRTAILDAEEDGTRIALMLIDVDHFKQINDSLGHMVGDAMLISFANRLRTIIRASDNVARLGGDEFAVLLTGINRTEEVSTIVQSLTERLNKPMEHDGRLVDCRASIGLAIYPDHAHTAELLTRCSDLALAEAKQSRGCVETFRHSMGDEFERESAMLQIARQGIELQRITPHYQPKVALNSRKVVGFEALVRCDLNDGPAILPEMFNLAFGDRELAAAISQQMIGRVLDDVRRWVDSGLEFGHIAINTCAADFRANDFAETLLANIERCRLDPRLIEVEVTEGVFLGRGAHHVARALSVLSDRGIRIALDDFGTGFASLTHLKQFPVDVLKIDRSFVAGIGINPDDTAIVRALIGLGQSLGIEIVAEGIETKAQAEFVETHGCNVGQGFLYSHAKPASCVPSMIQQLGDNPAG